MNWTNVKLIFLREFRDQLRDRRTLFVIVVLPLLLYPLLGVTFMQISQFMQQHPSRVLMLTDGALPTEPLLVDGDRLANVLDIERRVTVTVSKIETTDEVAIHALAMEEIDSDAQDAVVYFPASLGEMYSSDTSASNDTTTEEMETDSIGGKSEMDEESESGGKAVPSGASHGPGPLVGEPQVFVNSARDRSRLAGDRIRIALNVWRDLIVDQTLEDHQLPKTATTPFNVVTQDVSEPNVRRAAMWSKILPFVLMLWTMTGAFYPAIDLCAGEKERGTLETLLSGPAERIDIVGGKLLTVMAFSIATAMLNLVCMCFSASFVFSSLASQIGADAPISLGPPPIMSLIWLVPILIPLSALFGAVSIALATMARSTKEGQYYLMPILLITMPLVMLPMLPATELTLGTSLIPLTGLVLVVRQLIEQEYAGVLLHAVPVFVVTGGCCWFAVRWAVDQFNNETVLFRESERFTLGAWVKGLVRDRGPLPSPSEAILCGLLILLVRFFAGMHVGVPTDWPSFVRMVSVTMLGFIAAPALLMAVMLTTRPLRTLSLRRPSWMTVPLAAVLAILLNPLAMTLGAVVRYLYPMDENAYESTIAGMEKIITQAPSMLSLLVVMAVLPAICEELTFRGFILSGLRRHSKWRAIIVSSVFFGLAHFAVQQSLVAGVFGLVLGYLAIQTGSVIPCMVFHMFHNGMNILSIEFLPRLYESLPGMFRETIEHGEASYLYDWPVVLAATLLAALVLRWFRDQSPATFYIDESGHESSPIDANAVGMVAR